MLLPARKKTSRLLLAISASISLLFIGAGVGAAFSRGLNVTWRGSYDIQYVDFIGIVLSALSLLLTVLAIVLAIFGVIGWASFSERLKENTNAFLSRQLSEGQPLYSLIRKEVRDAVYEGVAPVTEAKKTDELPERPFESDV